MPPPPPAVSAQLVGVMAANCHVEAADDGAAGEWDDYVVGRPDATLYHLFGWKTVAQRAYGLAAPFLVARERAGGPVRGVLPLFVVPRPLMSYLTNGLFGAYGAVLADDERHAAALIRAAALRVDAGDARHLHLKLLGGAPAGVALERRDVWVRAKLELGADEDAVWRRLPRKLRWAVRNARRSGLYATCGPGQFESFYDVLSDNLRRKGAPVYGRTFFDSTLRFLGARADLVTLRHGGQPVSGALVAALDGTMYMPFASSRPEYFRAGVNQLLYAEVVRLAYERGCHTLDLGTSIRDSSALAFKLHWRPRVEPIASYVYAHRGALRIDPRGSAVAWAIASAYKRLPRSAAERVGPMLCRWIA